VGRGLPGDSFGARRAIAFISAPHGATLPRVYDRRAIVAPTFVQRRRHGLIIGVFASIGRPPGRFGLRDRLPDLVGLATGQNYGTPYVPPPKGIEPTDPAGPLASFLLSFVLVFLVMHAQQALVVDSAREIRLIPLGIPERFNGIAVPLVGIAYVATTLVSLGLLVGRSSRLSDLLPTVLIAITQALWWSIPHVAIAFGLLADVVPLGADFRSAFFPWIAMAHAGQYLWITSYYARAVPGWDGQGRYYGRVLLAGSAVWMLPVLAFAPGAREFDWNFALLLAAAVNIHHFVLDGAIWKLRHTKIARI
jgi:hypothetical protein